MKIKITKTTVKSFKPIFDGNKARAGLYEILKTTGASFKPIFDGNKARAVVGRQRYVFIDKQGNPNVFLIP